MQSDVLGTVSSVSRANGTCCATLRSGLALTDVPYQGMPPWPMAEARFTEVAAGSWICHGAEGELGGFGPNLCTNGEFEQDTTGWDSTVGVVAWQFDATSESWTGSSASVARGTTFIYQGAGSLTVTATSTTTISAISPVTPTGLQFAVTVGTTYNGAAWVLHDPSKTSRSASIRIKWYTSGGAFISNSTAGTAVMTDSSAWRSINVTAVAPATAAFGSVEILFASVTSGDVFYIDTVAATGGSNSNLTRDTSFSASGAASLRIRSAAAGVIYAQYPSPASEPLGGIPCTENQAIHVECKFRQADGNTMFIIAAWTDSTGTVFKTEFDQDSTSKAGTSSFQLFTAIFRVPAGAVCVHFAFATFVLAATKDLNIDSIGIRQAFVWEGAVWSSRNTVSSAQQFGPLVLKAYPVEESATAGLSFPKGVWNGHLYSKAVHGRLKSVSGQNVPNSGALTFITMDAIAEQSGMIVASTATDAIGYLQALRTGYYKMAAQACWSGWAFGGAGSYGIFILRYSSDGSTLLENVCGETVTNPGVGTGNVITNCSMTARWNTGERLYLVSYETCGGAGGINLTAGFGLAHMLAATYAGDAA